MQLASRTLPPIRQKLAAPVHCLKSLFVTDCCKTSGQKGMQGMSLDHYRPATRELVMPLCAVLMAETDSRSRRDNAITGVVACPAAP
jgi:hypothetical protein